MKTFSKLALLALSLNVACPCLAQEVKTEAKDFVAPSVQPSTAPLTVSKEKLDKQLVKELVEEILQENPTLILNLLKEHSEAVLDIAQEGSNVRKKRNLEAQWKEDMKTEKKVRTTNRPVMGDPKAKVTIVAFSDFTCHYCQLASSTLDTLLKEYEGKVKMVFKNLPLDEKGAGGLASAYFIALAQQSEEKAWKFYKAMFENREQLLAEGEKFIRKIAKRSGGDLRKINKDLKGRKVNEILREDLEDAQKLNIEGTPYFLVNDLVIRGALPLDLFRNAIDMALVAVQNAD